MTLQSGTPSLRSRWSSSRSSPSGRTKLAGAGISGAGIAVSAGANTGIAPISSPRWRRIEDFHVPETGSASLR